MKVTDKQWDERYVSGALPWDTNRPSLNLIEAVSQNKIAPCTALEFGCGTGANAVWLAVQGFDVTATDLAPTAIARAQRRAEGAGVTVDFRVVDMLAEPVPNGPFAFVFDRGCFHSFDSDAERATCARVIREKTAPGGLWLSVIGSTDGPDRDVGPPRRSAAQIAVAVEPHFEILSLTTTVLDSDAEDPPRAWRCFMRRRG